MQTDGKIQVGTVHDVIVKRGVQECVSQNTEKSSGFLRNARQGRFGYVFMHARLHFVE